MDAKATRLLMLGGGGMMLTSLAVALLAAATGAAGSAAIPTEPLPPLGTRVIARRTPLTRAEMMALVIAEYRRRFGRTLTAQQAGVLVAQWGVETAWGRSTYNFNFGNLKASKSWRGQFTVLLTYEYHRRNGVIVRERWRAPFRAYATPQDGVSAWMGVLLSERHGRALQYVLAADPTGFGRALANVADGGTGYATARADHYGRAIHSAYSSMGMGAPRMGDEPVVEVIPTEPLPKNGTRVRSRRTPLTRDQMLELVTAEYLRRYGAVLTQEQAAVLVAQWGIETGWGKSTYNYNFGNVKAGPSWTGDYNLLLTYEYHRRDGEIVRERWRAPFRAYNTAEEGVAAWMGVLFSDRHGRSREFVLAADPAGFGTSLANVADGGTGYATARAGYYSSAIKSAHSSVLA